MYTNLAISLDYYSLSYRICFCALNNINDFLYNILIYYIIYDMIYYIILL